jgi:hypothetical protein
LGVVRVGIRISFKILLQPELVRLSDYAFVIFSLVIISCSLEILAHLLHFLLFLELELGSHYLGMMIKLTVLGF